MSEKLQKGINIDQYLRPFTNIEVPRMDEIKSEIGQMFHWVEHQPSLVQIEKFFSKMTIDDFHLYIKCYLIPPSRKRVISKETQDRFNEIIEFLYVNSMHYSNDTFLQFILYNYNILSELHIKSIFLSDHVRTIQIERFITIMNITGKMRPKSQLAIGREILLGLAEFFSCEEIQYFINKFPFCMTQQVQQLLYKLCEKKNRHDIKLVVDQYHVDYDEMNL